jgi:translation initiation factor eIF-2B subunit delta
MDVAIRKADAVLLGADALLKKGIINKIGSFVAAEMAHSHGKPLYVLADSWKFYPGKMKMEERDFHEVWKLLPKNSRIRVMNPAFEFVPKKRITKIVSELGISSYDAFLRKVSGKRDF